MGRWKTGEQGRPSTAQKGGKEGREYSILFSLRCLFRKKVLPLHLLLFSKQPLLRRWVGKKRERSFRLRVAAGSLPAHHLFFFLLFRGIAAPATTAREGRGGRQGLTAYQYMCKDALR